MDPAKLEYAMFAQQQQHHHQQQQQPQQQQLPSRLMQGQPSAVYSRLVDNNTEQSDLERNQHSQSQNTQQHGQTFVHAAASAPPPPPIMPPSSQNPSTIVVPMPDPQKPTFFSTNGSQTPISCDIKPRLTKEQHDILESHFQKQNKPNTSTKKGFAETLNVSLDKVNNWFQNRRAKSKQDAKKLVTAQTTVAPHDQAQQSSQHLQQRNSPVDADSQQQPQQQQQENQHQHVNGLVGNGSDPAHVPLSDAEYYSLMQSCVSGDATLSNHAAGAMSSQDAFANQMSMFASMGPPNALDMSHLNNDSNNYFDMPLPQPPSQVQHDMFDSPQELNRRTLTQEQFDAFSQSGLPPQADYHLFPSTFAGNIHSNPLASGDIKQQELSIMANGMHVPLSSHDSTVPSSISDGSTYHLSDWADSRSSSISGLHDDNVYSHVPAAPPSEASSSLGIWSSAHSSLADLHAINQEYQQVGQVPVQMSQEQPPLMWPSEHHSAARDAQALQLSQQLSHVELQTPQPQQNAQFKSPPPPSSIAARRQRPRPAALGIASLRSQSYSGTGQPASPGAGTQSASVPPQAQTLRRIRSSNVVNGVTQGRVQKGLPGSAQRSPLVWTFADSLSSPKALRHQSSGNLAPPTPMSPKEFVWQPPQPPTRAGSQWQNTNKQPSISETAVEHLTSAASTTTVLGQTVSSPPHTPMFQQHPFLQHLGNGVIVENTPPQSAPATQTSFFNTFPSTSGQMHSRAPTVAQTHSGQTQAFSEMQQQFMNAAVSEHPSMHDAALYHPQNLSSSVPEHGGALSMQYPGGVAHSTEHGQPMPAYAAQVQYFQNPNQAPGSHTAFQDANGYDPQQTHANMTNTSPGSHPENPSNVSEFFVHEYNPPADSAARVPEAKRFSDAGPKSYTFANQGPEHFEKGKKAIDAKSTQFPPASTSTASSETMHEYQAA